ncbi:MAG: hypothetical protein JW951_06100 [Lentisphaerae bacterium]|nr:hypothetical protein [Lentisphaerota bacterium]
MDREQHTQESYGARLERRGEETGPPTAEAVERRAREIARIEGRDGSAVTEEDRLRASRELRDAAGPPASDEATAALYASHNPADMAVDEGREIKRRQPADEQQLQEDAVAEGLEEAEHERLLRGREARSDELGGT